MRHNIFLFVLFMFFWGQFDAQVQCAVDVMINEGDAISMCADAPTTISGSNGFVSYDWTGPESVSGQSITPQFSGLYYLSATDGIGCISIDSIQVTINANPIPVILSSEGNPICASSGGTTLSLSSAYVSYDWGGGVSTPTFFAPGAGAYAVSVFDNNGCSGQQVITITESVFSLTTTITSGCEGSTALLSAFGGASYLWSTGETGSSIVVSPASTTVYSVTITSGTCSENLTTTVETLPPFEYELPDTLYMGVGDVTFLDGPAGFVSYYWSPTEQLGDSTSQGVNFTAQYSETITIQATHPSGCVLTDQVVIIVVDLTIPNGFSPNGDLINEYFVIPEIVLYEGKLQIWNRWGDVVLEDDAYKNTWGGTCETMFCIGNDALPEGTYFYHLTVHDINFDGFITLKR